MSPSAPSRHKGARSLRRDLALGFGGGIVMLWIASLLLGWLVLREEITEIYDAALMRTADRLLVLSGETVETPHSRALMAEIRAPDGTIAFSTASSGQAIFAAAPESGLSVVDDYRVFALRTPDGKLLRVADPLSERREAAREALTTLLVPSVLLLPLAFLGVWIFTRRRLAPVRAFSAEVAGRDASDLRPIETRDLPQELDQIRAAVDHLMARLSEAIAAERGFSSNAAHELRTPIAATLAQTQRLIAEADTDALRSRAEAVALSLRRIADLTEKLIDLARAEAVGESTAAPEDIRPVLRLVLSDFVAPLEVDMPETPVALPMNVDAFAVLVRNLIQNALVHGTPPVRVTLGKTGRTTVLSVENAGPIVAPDLLPRLTRRFERAGSRKSGSGLGLAIVDTIARKAGARLELASPCPGRKDGFRARVIFDGPEG